MSIANKLQIVADNLATENEKIIEQASILAQISEALDGKTGTMGGGGDYNEGYADGYEVGYDDGYDEGYADGTAQGGDGEDDLPYGYLKADPTWTNFANLCYARPNMIKHLKYSDTSNCTNFLATFSTITTVQTSEDVVIPRLDYRKAQTIQNMCIYSNRIVEIGEMEIPKVTEASNAFAGCTELKRISFVAGCINVNISFSGNSKLDDASIQSIIDGLADLTGKTAQTLTLHATVGAKLTDAQKASASAKNWTLAY